MLILAALWGFSEATLFFIVPDVIVSFVTLRYGLGAAIRASFASAAAAALGGLVMYLWAASDPATARAALAALPAIDGAMIDAVSARFAVGGYPAMLAGAFSGVPYKIYAVLAGETGRSLPLFIALSPLIRLPRFVMTALLAALFDRVAAHRTTKGARYWVLAAFWVVFYAGYFTVMS